MNARFRQLVLTLNASYWFLPALLTVTAFILSFVTYYVDVRLGSGWVTDLWWLHSSKPDGARSLLSSISGSMISVAGTVFAITVAAVVYASGNYGPRLLTNFMTDRGNQVSLGIFIATFVYSLMTLRTIRQPDEGGGVGFVPELSLLIAIFMALLSVGVLVYFLHHVPDSIRINNVVAGIGKRALRDIRKRYPDAWDGHDFDYRGEPKGRAIAADDTGYLAVVDFASLRDTAKDKNVVIHLKVRGGDFVHPHVPLAVIESDPQELCTDDDLRSAFAIGDSRTSSQDVEYSIDELVEIALRALSPGINDPFTAITCIHWLGAATTVAAHRDLRRDPDGHPYGDAGVFAIADDFDHFVARGFGSVRTSAATNVIAARILFEAIEATALTCPSSGRRETLVAEAQLLMAQAELGLEGPALDDVRRRHEELTAVLKHAPVPV